VSGKASWILEKQKEYGETIPLIIKPTYEKGSTLPLSFKVIYAAPEGEILGKALTIFMTPLFYFFV